MSLSSLEAYVQKIEPDVRQWRRTFHQVPETGWTEYVTTYRLYEALKELGYNITLGRELLNDAARMGLASEKEEAEAIHRAQDYGVAEELLQEMAGGFTGLAAELDTGRPGPHIVYRFDIDALPIQEAETEAHLPFAEGFHSSIPGAMHACGHDVHAAMGLGVAKALQEEQGAFNGRFTLLFQPAEEGSRGAKSMVEAGWVDEADAFIAAHIGLKDEAPGVIAATASKFLATTKFNVNVEGTSAHAAAKPEEGRDALAAAASMALKLQEIPPHSEGVTRVHTGTLTAGEGRNIVASTAELTGETRGENSKLNDYMFTEVKRRVEACAHLYGVTAELEVVGQGEAADCDLVWQQRMKKAAEGSSMIHRVDDSWPVNASEDAALMMNRVQERGGEAVYMVIGTGLKSGHHKPTFDIDEASFAPGVLAYLLAARQFQAENDKKVT
ncbi:aminobenzoyl-glutamate utilization protein A [Salsuginibacillus halophilus]|uniref:Aminobenzoyl-glutamate utilization protein A n=1 Tax=Salsuginibacillus halophilus TaxID=517424 RepID=A0A2P8HW15_9BACI|nr:amidohydrolase [Salsuginibacillus halophilus]PSL50433.1 aminobenzoyl-glutamate utilization protein A [Salsuginibacillus halophilus]